MPDDDLMLERLSVDDAAQAADEYYRAVAIARCRHAEPQRGVPGVCTNCGECCLPTTVYCDQDCRADHEARERKRLRGTVG